MTPRIWHLIYYIGLWLFIQSLGFNIPVNGIEKPIWHGNRNSPKVALTFDDGPHPNDTHKILKILAQNQISATFFIVGQAAKNNPNTLRAIYNAGHEIANHTFFHPRLDTLDQHNICLEIQATNDIVNDVVGVTPRFFRPPGGRYNRLVLECVSNSKLKMVLWDVNAGDYYHPIPNDKISKYPYAKNKFQIAAHQMTQKVVKRTQNGSILLFHNTDGETLKAIPIVIRKLKEKGVQFVQLQELLSSNSKNRIRS